MKNQLFVVFKVLCYNENRIWGGKNAKIVEDNEKNKQSQIYLIQYEHKVSGQKIVQVYNTEEEYQLRLNEISDSTNHFKVSGNMVRNGNYDMFLTRFEVG